MTLISIVIPAYNCENYIENCVISIMEQSMKNFEVIIIDDGSTDDTYKVMEKLKNKYRNYIKIYTHSNMGAGATRNKGIKLSHGKYITFIDADDRIDKDYIDNLYNNIGNNDIVISGYKKTEIDTGKTLYECNPENEVWSELKYVSTCGKMYRLDYLLKNEIEYKLTDLSEDVYFNLLCCTHTNKIKIIDYAGYCYNTNENSITSTINGHKNMHKMLSLLIDINENINFSKYPIKISKYFYVKTAVQQLLIQLPLLSSQDINLEYQKLFDWLEAKRFLKFNFQRGETFKINLCVNTFILFHKVRIMKVLLKFLKILRIEIN